MTNSAKNQQLRSPKPQPPRSNSKDPRLTPGVFLVIRTKAGHPLSKNTAKQNRADAPAYENRPYFFLIRSGFSPIGPAGAPNAHRAILLFSAAGTAARPTARSRPMPASGTASAQPGIARTRVMGKSKIRTAPGNSRCRPFVTDKVSAVADYRATTVYTVCPPSSAVCTAWWASTYGVGSQP